MSLRLQRSLLASVVTSLTFLLTMNHSTQYAQKQPTSLKAGRSVVRAQHGMVATSQPLASQVGLEVLKRALKCVEVGRITREPGVHLTELGVPRPLPARRGFDHLT